MPFWSHEYVKFSISWFNRNTIGQQTQAIDYGHKLNPTYISRGINKVGTEPLS